jgi:hypothetical protein
LAGLIGVAAGTAIGVASGGASGAAEGGAIGAAVGVLIGTTCTTAGYDLEFEPGSTFTLGVRWKQQQGFSAQEPQTRKRGLR